MSLTDEQIILKGSLNVGRRSRKSSYVDININT
jgi:hypothetical protein